MKQRLGFVSNSSSSSYLVAGVQMDLRVAESLLAKAGIDVPWEPEDVEDGAPWDEFDEPGEAAERLGLRLRDSFVGMEIMYTGDEGYGSGELSSEQVQERLQRAAGILGVEVGQLRYRLIFSGMCGDETW